MKYFSSVQQFINTESRTILLLCISFLSIWGLWIIIDAYGLFCQTNGGIILFGTKYIFNKQIFGLFVGVVLFLVIQKYNFTWISKHSWILIVLAVFTFYTSISNYSAKYFHTGVFNISLRGGLLITFLIMFYLASDLQKEKSYSRWEVIILISSVLLGNILLSGYGEMVMAFIFVFSFCLYLFFTIGKALSAITFFTNLSINIFISLTYHFSRNGILETYFGKDTFYQVSQSIKCFVAGGLSGIGPASTFLINQSSVKKILSELHYPNHLPDFQEGFIFSVLGLQYGFIGVLISIISFLIIIYLGLKAVEQAKTKSLAFLVLSTTIIFSLSVFIGMATPLKILPPNGEGIPLLSAGMNRIIFAFFTFGLIYKNLDPENDSPNHLSINTKVLFFIIILLYLVIPLVIIYYHLKWKYSAAL